MAAGVAPALLVITPAAAATGVYCSISRTVTLVARDGATSAAFPTALHTLANRVLQQTGIQLRPEP
ncbi:hypothetical protein ACTMTI_49140 [Nonomuraea sp. H19]|uniref:hypothetical protein n=1 Tax=Nonomuraea sp. H19 TaxID=3452206 RepID=UPI003F8BC6AB